MKLKFIYKLINYDLAIIIKIFFCINTVDILNLFFNLNIVYYNLYINSVKHLSIRTLTVSNIT